MTIRLSEGKVRCTCGQTLEFKTEREEKIKLVYIASFVQNPPEGSVIYEVPRPAMTCEEQQIYRTEFNRKVYS